jgi:hypothetical protein
MLRRWAAALWLATSIAFGSVRCTPPAAHHAEPASSSAPSSGPASSNRASRDEQSGHADAPDQQVGRSRPASPTELAIVEGLMHETESLRGLRFLAPVEVRIEDRAAMRAYVDRALDDEQLRRATRRYLALGALDENLDVRALLVSVMEEELVGYYDPKKKRLAVRSDIARELGMASTHGVSSSGEPPVATRSERSLTWRATVVHELVHALQDQHFGLGTTIEQKRSTDADNAFGALIEGDATLVMLGYTVQLAGESLDTLAQHPERVLSAMSRSPDQLTGALRKAPALLREPLLFRYREGAHFCAELYRDGGWARVDAAHRVPPSTTLSVRNPRRYLDRSPEPSLRLPEVSWLHERGYEAVDDDVLGGLELSVVLETAGVEAEYIVSAWRGDRYLVLEHQAKDVSLWWLHFATSATARNVGEAFERLHDPARRVARKASSLLVARGLDAASFVRATETLGTLGSVQPARTPATTAHIVSRSASRAPVKRGDPLATNTHRH